MSWKQSGDFPDLGFSPKLGGSTLAEGVEPESGAGWSFSQGVMGPTALPGGLELDQGMGQGAAGVVLAGGREHQALLDLQTLRQDSPGKFVCGHFMSRISACYSLRVFWTLASLYFKASCGGSSLWC